MLVAAACEEGCVITSTQQTGQHGGAVPQLKVMARKNQTQVNWSERLTPHLRESELRMGFGGRGGREKRGSGVGGRAEF